MIKGLFISGEMSIFMYMNETITILEALVIGVATVLVYTFVKTVYEYYFKSSK